MAHEQFCQPQGSPLFSFLLSCAKHDFRRILELGAAIKSTFEPVVQTSLYPRSQIDIYVHVLQQDGGLTQASINATTLALVSAGIPLLDLVCAVTGGVHSASPMLDLTTLEENDVPHLTVAVMPKTSKVTLVTMETRLHVDRFGEIFRLACEAAQVIHKEMKRVVKARTQKLVHAMEAGPRVLGEYTERDVDMDMT
jgi:exosome complex component RRP41